MKLNLLRDINVIPTFRVDITTTNASLVVLNQCAGSVISSKVHRALLLYHRVVATYTFERRQFFPGVAPNISKPYLQF